MVFRNRRELSSSRSPRAIWADWMAANKAGDAARAGACARELTEAAPARFDAWFEAGLYAKARREWEQCIEWNARAVELFGPRQARAYDGVNPAAWNLGIAATALANWATARRAWSAYGIGGLDEGDGEIDLDCGYAPIRLNPDQPSLALEVSAAFGATEVVWTWRRSPAHAVIASVPLPESGHRFRDVILHDGEPKGSRNDGEHEVSVFDEITRLQDSGLPTWQAQVSGATAADVDAMSNVFGPRGLGADNWSGINLLCSSCSHGSPNEAHHHGKPSDGTITLGLAGAEDEVAHALEEWRSVLPHLEVLAVDLLW